MVKFSLKETRAIIFNIIY